MKPRVADRAVIMKNETGTLEHERAAAIESTARGRNQGPSRLRRQAWDLGVLLALPLILLAFDRNWIFPAMIHDPWIYLGYGLDPWHMLPKFQGYYYGERLTIVLPLAAAHAVLPPMAAQLAISLLLYLVSVGSLYFLVARAIGMRTAFLTALVLGTNSFFLDAIGRDYSDGYGIAYFLAATWCASRVAQTSRGRLAAAAAGVCIVAMVVANLAYLILAPFPLLVCLVFRDREQSPLQHLSSLLCFCLGGLVLFLALGMVYWATAGNFWFLHRSLLFSRNAVNPSKNFMVDGRIDAEFPDESWVLDAVWLALPAAVCAVSAMIAARFRGKSKKELWSAEFLWPVLFLLLALMFLAIECLTYSKVLQLWFYASLLIPLTMLAFAALIGRSVEALDEPAYRRAALLSVLLLAAQAVLPRGFVNFLQGIGPPLFPGLALIAAALGALARGTRAVGTMVAVVLLAAGMLAARVGFWEENSVRVFEMPTILPVAKSGPGREKLAPYALRMHLYDDCRADAYLAVVDAQRFVQANDRRNQVLYWFDMFEPHAILFDKLACTRTRDRSFVNFNFPLLPDRFTFHGIRIGGGQLIAIPSGREEVLDAVRGTMKALGLEVRSMGRRLISRGKIRFWVHLVALRDPNLDAR